MEISKIMELKKLAEELIAEYKEDEFMVIDEDNDEEVVEDNNTIDKAIDEIHKIYVATNHIWFNLDEVPTKEELKKTLIYLIDEIKKRWREEMATWWLFVRDLEDWVLEFWYETSYFINS